MTSPVSQISNTYNPYQQLPPTEDSNTAVDQEIPGEAIEDEASCSSENKGTLQGGSHGSFPAPKCCCILV